MCSEVSKGATSIRGSITSELLMRCGGGRSGIQVLKIREALCWRAWCLALTYVVSTGVQQQDCWAMPIQVPLMSH